MKKSAVEKVEISATVLYSQIGVAFVFLFKISQIPSLMVDSCPSTRTQIGSPNIDISQFCLLTMLLS